MIRRNVAGAGQRPATYFWQEAALLTMAALPHRVDEDRDGDCPITGRVRAAPHEG